MAKIILGVSSSISVYKSLELVSQLKKKNHQVYSILTKNAQKFISPSLFHNLSGCFVNHNYFDKNNPHQMEHIRLAKNSELLILYPGSANTIAKLSLGMADDLLTTTALVTQCPLLIFPAMNPNMWHHPATKHNVASLRKKGVKVIDPSFGEVACGDVGAGKLLEVELALEKIMECLQPPSTPSTFKGKKVLLTMGGSLEPIDPVRAIVNGSSGKMGLALAKELKKRKAVVDLLVGRISSTVEASLLREDGLEKISHFTSTEDLLANLKNKIDKTDILIMNAAPGDFKVKKASEQKIKSQPSLTLDLVQNPDILKTLPQKPGQVFVGFAAEVQNLKVNALDKLKNKNLNLIVANRVHGQIKINGKNKKIGIGEDHTHITILDKSGVLYQNEQLPISKKQAAKIILDILERKLT